MEMPRAYAYSEWRFRCEPKIIILEFVLALKRRVGMTWDKPRIRVRRLDQVAEALNNHQANAQMLIVEALSDGVDQSFGHPGASRSPEMREHNHQVGNLGEEDSYKYLGIPWSPKSRQYKTHNPDMWAVLSDGRRLRCEIRTLHAGSGSITLRASDMQRKDVLQFFCSNEELWGVALFGDLLNKAFRLGLKFHNDNRLGGLYLHLPIDEACDISVSYPEFKSMLNMTATLQANRAP